MSPDNIWVVRLSDCRTPPRIIAHRITYSKGRLPSPCGSPYAYGYGYPLIVWKRYCLFLDCMNSNSCFLMKRDATKKNQSEKEKKKKKMH